MSESKASSTPDQSSPSTADRQARRRDPARSSKLGGLWLSLVALGVVSVLLLVFIVQNTETAEVTFLGWQADMPLAVALLAAAAAGLLVAATAGSLRIWQLRRRIRHTEASH